MARWIIGIAICLGLFAPFSAALEVSIPDPNLEAALRDALSKPTGPLTDTDLASLTSFAGVSRNIVDLTGLEHCTNLWGLNLGDNQISNISPIAGLTKLTYVNLYINQIRDISAVAGLTNLTHLYLYNNQVSDISSVAGLVGLRSVSLYNNQISDITAIAGLANLTELSLSSNQISDINPIAGLSNLRSANLHSNEISDISAVAELTNLTELYLYNNQISDISAVAGLTNLVGLRFDHNRIGDMNAVARLINLTHLSLYLNQISDINPIAGLTKLTYVNLYSNQIRDISAVAELTNLTELYLSNNQIRDISAIAGLTNLATLDLGSNYISDLQPAVDNTALDSGDRLSVTANPLDGTAHNTEIPVLQARGVNVTFSSYSGSVHLSDENPAGTWNYQVNHTDGSIYGWEYHGSTITAATVDGAAQSAGWEVITQTDSRVLFASKTALGSGSLTGFHVTGVQGGSGSYDCGTNQSTIDGPLPIVLSSFSVTPTQEGALLTWHTESEESNLGFHVSWSPIRDGEYVRITPTLIPGHGTDAAPRDYQFLAANKHNAEEEWYQLESTSYSGRVHIFPPIQLVRRIEYSEAAEAQPNSFALWSNYPNPFNPETWIPYELASDSEVSIRIFDALGHLVWESNMGHQLAGSYTDKSRAIHWDGTNGLGEDVSSGVYHYELRADEFRAMRRMTVLR